MKTEIEDTEIGDIRSILKFMYEAGQLKRVKRSGWWLAGVKNAESVAEHVYRACVVGWLIAEMEGANPERVVSLIAFHDMAETRSNDFHKVAARYFEKREAELRIVEEQTSEIPHRISENIRKLFQEFKSGDTKESIVARDADYVEASLQAKEYAEQGFESANNWIQNVKKLVRTESAKRLVDGIEHTTSTSWWKGLKKLD